MKLIPIRHYPNSVGVLWDLLEERSVEQSISHKRMPTKEEHEQFVLCHPYSEWYVIQNALGVVGAIYLSKQAEIGISIYREFQGRGFAPQAINLLMEEHGPCRYLANINPANEPSRRMFEKLGFKLVQHTYALEAE